ncbi:DNA damage-inducible protein 1, partial [Basidiobolus ranarum]
MKLTLTTEQGDLHNLEVDPSMELENLLALIEAETGTAPDSQQLYHNGKILSDKQKSLKELGVNNDDIILVRIDSSKVAVGSSQAGSAQENEYEQRRQHIINDTRLLQQLAQSHPQLAQAALSDPSGFANIMRNLETQRKQAEQSRISEMAALEANPFDIDAQRKIEEAIRMENVMSNMEAALEFNPESFGRVTMLYINVEVNG